YACSLEAAEQSRTFVSEAEKVLGPGDTSAAAEHYLNALELAPREVRALWGLYQIRQREGKHGAALMLLQRLVIVDPNHVAARQELALILFNRGDLAGADLH